MKIELKDYNVETKDELSFGDMEDIQSIIGSGEDLLKGNAKLMEVSILSIENKEGEKVSYSDSWRRNLNMSDGVKLSQEVQKLVSDTDDKVKKN